MSPKESTKEGRESGRGMKKNGFTSIILLAELDGWYLVTGTHRYLAARKLAEEDIEVEIKYVDVTDAIEAIAKEKT